MGKGDAMGGTGIIKKLHGRGFIRSLMGLHANMKVDMSHRYHSLQSEEKVVRFNGQSLLFICFVVIFLISGCPYV